MESTIQERDELLVMTIESSPGPGQYCLSYARIVSFENWAPNTVLSRPTTDKQTTLLIPMPSPLIIVTEPSVIYKMHREDSGRGGSRSCTGGKRFLGENG
jgi:hypothetical protein